MIYTHEKMLIMAHVLNENGYFSNCQDVIDFFEKPHKWQASFDECEQDE